MTKARDDILIIGAGVIGLSSALALLKAGRGVRVIDSGRVGRGSSHGNCGTITPSHATPLAAPGMILKGLKWMLQPDAPFYVKPRLDPAMMHWLLRFAARCNARDYRAGARPKAALLSASRDMLERTIRDEALDCEFQTTGLTYVYRDAREFDTALTLIDDLREFEIRAEVLDPQRLEHEEPALLPGLEGGIHFPDDAALRPDRLVAELARRVRECGGVIEEELAVEGFVRRPDGGIGAVRTAQGERAAQEFVLACGAWSPRVLKPLGLNLPIQPGKGYSITYPRPALVPNRPLVLRERSVCVTAWGSGFRLGSTMEFSGYDSHLNPLRLAALERAAGEYLHEPVGARTQEHWYGWRPMTWDDLPILGRPARIANLMLATGHGMLGVSMSAASAQLVAAMICGGECVVAPAPYSPGRFGI
jgi:D-amino-acid dehydrogenase